jgi:hypothetical protein
MRAHGFSIDFMVDLVRPELATATSEYVMSGPNGQIKSKSRACGSTRGGGCSANNDSQEPESTFSSSAKAELAAILERRPDLKGKSPEAAKRILRREARLSIKPLRSRRGSLDVVSA